MIIYGSRGNTIGRFDIQGTTCEYCHHQSTQQVTVFGRYAHIFWIPLFPIGRKSVSECSHCKRTLAYKEFPEPLKNRFDQKKGDVKRPWWHWFGLGLIGFFFIVMPSLGAFASLFIEPDPREAQLEADLKEMSATPTLTTDSTAYLMKTFFDDFVTDEMNSEAFEYRTKISGDKALILMKVPELKRIRKEERPELLSYITHVVQQQSDIEGKDLYIGVEGKYSLMLIQTPTDTMSSSTVSKRLLYGFYGEEPAE